MNAKTGIRGLVAGLLLLLPPVGASAHEIIPWGVYPSIGDVVISTKSKVLLDQTFLGQTTTIDVVPPGDTAYNVEVGSGLPSVYGFVNFTNPKGTKAKLTVVQGALDPWIVVTASLLREYREKKGDVVQDVTVTPKKAQGTATFKTKPTPIGPLHKANLNITIKFKGVVTLEGGVTKQGTVTMTVTSKGVRQGIPGED